MKSFNTERIFCCSSIILIKNRCFIFLCVSINKCHNPLSLKVLLKYMKRCKRTNNHLQTISAHVLFSHFHSFSRRDGLDTKAFGFGFVKTGVSPRESSSTGRILKRLSSPCRSWRAPCRSPTTLASIRERLSPREPVWLLARSCWGDPGTDFTDSVEQNLNIFRSLKSCFELLLVPLRLPQS